MQSHFIFKISLNDIIKVKLTKYSSVQVYIHAYKAYNSDLGKLFVKHFAVF